ncbi:MAG: ABC transporter ATP-binding protein [Bacteroidota bacterium]|nr:ABC transporter ATP-binding protein [Bacteroidota bacterium]
MIEGENLHKSFGSLHVLKGVNIHVETGEIVSVVGPSGAGKTTLLQLLGTLDKADSGDIRIGGKQISKLKDREQAEFRNKHIGFVFQFHQLLPEFTALENVMIPALISGDSHKIAEKKAREILQYMKMQDRLGHKPAQLSGGENQRVAVARALVNHPDVVLADEPSGSLDTKNKEELHQLFFDLRNELNQTFVIVTHDTQLARLTDRVLEMRDGLILAENDD